MSEIEKRIHYPRNLNYHIAKIRDQSIFAPSRLTGNSNNNKGLGGLLCSMASKITKYKITLWGFAVSLISLLCILVFEVDAFEALANFLWLFEDFELDEIIIPLFVFSIFLIVNLVKNQKEHELEAEKIKIYKAMLTSSQHVINNLLNEIQLFKIEAEATPEFPSETLSLFNEVTEEASQQIKALSSIENVDEDSIFQSIRPTSGQRG